MLTNRRWFFMKIKKQSSKWVKNNFNDNFAFIITRDGVLMTLHIFFLFFFINRLCSIHI